MTTPTGVITMADVNAELGAANSATRTLNDSGVRTLAEISSGTVSMNDLRGRTRVQLSNQSISHSDTVVGQPDYVYSGIYIESTGAVYEYRYSTTAGYSYPAAGYWAPVTGTLSPGTLEIYASYSGDSCSGNSAFNTWLPLNLSRYWYVTNVNGSAGTTQSRSATITLTIRRVGSGTNLASASYTVSATSTYNLAKPTAIEMLLAGGGGGGGWGAAAVAGAGGGAGGLYYASVGISPNTQYNVSIGGGGASNGGSGSSSTAFGGTAYGGGGGGGVGGATGGGQGASGGSGGGSSGYPSGGAGTSGQGNAGGAGSGSYGALAASGGGGGSFTGAGGNAIEDGGASAPSGGGGYNESWPGFTTTWTAGGAGGAWNAYYNGSSGAGNTGSGGNGCGGLMSGGNYSQGGNGGSGRCQIRYSTSYAPASAYSGCTYYVSGGYRVYDFTGSGYITW